MSPKVEKLPIDQLTLGEGPHWDAATQSLYLVDIFGDQILRYHPATNTCYKAKTGVRYPGFIVPVSGVSNKFVVGCGTKLYILTWDGKSESVEHSEVLQETNEPATNRINDGKCDPSGRVWFGAMHITDYLTDKSAGFYSFSKKEGLVRHFSGVGISNGLTWDKNKNIFYYIDSVKMTVDAFDYNPGGKILNRRSIFDFRKNFSEDLPLPDGMTIDADGNLWVAGFSLSKVVKIDPTSGSLLQQIDIPVPQVTSVAFGGPKLDELYVTTAAVRNLESEEIPPQAGTTFRVTGLGVKGLPMQNFVL